MNCNSANFEHTEAFLSSDIDKWKAATPQTADSIPNENPMQSFSLEGAQLFTQCDFELPEEVVEEEEDQEIFSPHYETQIEGKKNCNFQVVLEMKSEENKKEEFTKSIDTFREKKEKCQLIFDRQHEKKNVKLGKDYQLNLLMRDLKGFRKNIWQHSYRFNPQMKKGNFKIQHHNMKLGFELQKFSGTCIKLLGLEMPTHKIEEFFDYRSQLLNKSSTLSEIKHLADLKGLYYPLSQQNMGSRILQKLLKKASFQEIKEMCEELKPEFPKMILDSYGNYVIQKIFSCSPSHFRSTLLGWLEKDLMKLLMTKTGTHTLQAIVQLLDVGSRQKVYELIYGQEAILCNNEFGTHFMQKMVELEVNYDFFGRILSYFQAIACNKYGIVVLKAIIKKTTTDYNIKCCMLEYAQANFSSIYADEFGHYIIEEIFKYYNEYELQVMLEYIAAYVVVISQNVFSSNIIKKGLQLFSQTWKNKLICYLLANEGEGVKELMETNPGSFVLHRIVQNSEGTYKEYLLEDMRKKSEGLHNYEKRTKWTSFFN